LVFNSFHSFRVGRGSVKVFAMTRLRFTFVLLLLLALAGSRADAALLGGGEAKTFEAASRFYQLKQWERAEAEFGEFIRQFPKSDRAAEAYWLRAQAQFAQRKFAAVVTGLEGRLGEAGNFGDQYWYWIGQAQMAQSNFVAAAEAFGTLARQFPNSARNFEAAVNEAMARRHQEEWTTVADLLRQPDGPFRRGAGSGVAPDLTARGFLLLAEAQFQLGDYAGAQAALSRVAENSGTELDWRRRHLLGKILVASGQLEAAERESGELITAAELTGRPEWVAAEVGFRADILEQLGRTNDMIATLRRNLTNAPPAWQREALWRITAVELKADRWAEATRTLLGALQHTNHGAADVALVALGELHLKQQAGRLPGPAGTNHLAAATNYLQRLVREFPESAYVGKAHLNLGWSYWLAGDYAASAAAFGAAVERLPWSEDLAVARFKLADALFAQREFAAALTNYQETLVLATNWPGLSEALRGAAGYQMLRASLAVTNAAGAEASLRMILAADESGAATPEGVLLVAQSYLDGGQFAEAQEKFAEFLARFPDSELRPEAELLLARMLEEQGRWNEVATTYETWLAQNGTNRWRVPVEFRRALAAAQAGEETNAWQRFSTFVAQHPHHELAPQAQWWVADWHYQQRNFSDAEIAYKELFNRWPQVSLAQQARMMAGRAAIGRAGHHDAIEHFIALTSDTNCPVELRIQALFARGGALQLSGNTTTNLIQARQVFRVILELQPGPEQAALAWGEIGNCSLQLAASDPTYYSSASNAYHQAVHIPAASVATRSQALFGLALVAEKQAGGVTEGARTDLLKRARDHYLDAYLGKMWPEAAPDLSWKRRAGREAARLSEALGEWAQALELYRDLVREQLFPVETLEKQIAEVQRQLHAGL
jgi:TolA-binding protein